MTNIVTPPKGLFKYVSSYTLRLNESTNVSQSNFNYQYRSYDFGTRQLELQLNFQSMPMADFRALEVFFNKLGRSRNLCLIELENLPFQGAETISLLLRDSVNAGDLSIAADTTLGLANTFRAGDYIQIGTGLETQLLKVADDVSTDELGISTINLLTPLKRDYQFFTPLEYKAPKGLFRAADIIEASFSNKVTSDPFSMIFLEV